VPGSSSFAPPSIDFVRTDRIDRTDVSDCARTSSDLDLSPIVARSDSTTGPRIFASDSSFTQRRRRQARAGDRGVARREQGLEAFCNSGVIGG